MTLLLAGLTLLSANTSFAQSPLAYTAAHLDCARFAETSHSDITTQTARGEVKATVDRAGVWTFRARDTTGGIAVESWYDSLAIRRRTGDNEVAADTDGLIGGRYRGVLTASGGYTEIARPFFPDEVAEVADLSGAVRDLLPPLPPRPLAPGEQWKESGVMLQRLPDTSVAGARLVHLRLQSRSDTGQTILQGDTMPIPLRQTTEESGRVYWSPATGFVRRTRDITVEATIPSGGPIRQAVRSRVTQRVELTRLPAQPSCK
jgi:hypothetical protein